ncbi:hypothetical protein L9F63_000553, partial [Diploptera punctata]
MKTSKEIFLKNDEGRKSTEEKNEFMAIQLKLFTFCFALPPKNILQEKSWKIKLYNGLLSVLLVSYVLVISMQLVAAYIYSQTVSDFSVSLFEIAASVLIISIICHFNLYRNQTYSIALKVQETFKSQIKYFPIKTEYHNILSERAAKNKIIVWTTIIVISVFSPTWYAGPFMMWYTYDGEDILQSINNQNSTNRIHWEFFCYRSWLPPNVYQTPTYQIYFCYQLFYIYLVTVNYLSCFTFFYAIVSFASAHFNLLAELIREVDRYIECSNFQKVAGDPIKLKENNLNNEIEDNGIDGIEVIQKTENQIKDDDFQISDEVDYFHRCIQYHQAIL